MQKKAYELCQELRSLVISIGLEQESQVRNAKDNTEALAHWAIMDNLKDAIESVAACAAKHEELLFELTKK
jgi:hypothetical protein